MVRLEPEEEYQRPSGLEQSALDMETKGVAEHIGAFVRQLDTEHGTLNSCRAMMLQRVLRRAAELIDPHDGSWEHHESMVGPAAGFPGNEEERQLRLYATWIQLLTRQEITRIDPGSTAAPDSKERYMTLQHQFEQSFRKEKLFKESRHKAELTQRAATDHLATRESTLRDGHARTLVSLSEAQHRAVTATREAERLTQATKTIEAQVLQTHGCVLALQDEARGTTAEYRRRDMSAASTLIRLAGETATLSHQAQSAGRTYLELQDITQLLARIGMDESRRDWAEDMQEVNLRYNDSKLQNSPQITGNPGRLRNSPAPAISYKPIIH